MLTEQAVPETYTIGEMIRVPMVLGDEDGVGHVRAIFKRMRRPGHRGPRGLDPSATLELRGNGHGHKQTTVKTTLEVADGHKFGDYLCVTIQVHDSKGNMQMIENPKPPRIFRIVDGGNRDDRKTRFLWWER